MALLGVIGWFHLKLLLDFLNLQRLGESISPLLSSEGGLDNLERTTEYISRKTRFSVLQDAAELAALICFWSLGGFAWLSHWSSQWGLGSVASGLLLLGALGLSSMILGLPFEWWQTFKVEAEFGLNRTTIGTFITDRVKGLLLTAVIGGGVGAFVLWVFENLPYAALWSWAAISAFSLLMAWLSPVLLMPLFMKFTPMAESPLRSAILGLAQKLDFPVVDIFLVDGSRRSTKANAFFTGMGRTRRIALFDTLVEQHAEGEILAVLAHEIGHAKLGHVPRMIAMSLLTSAVMFGCLQLGLQDERLYQAFGCHSGSAALGMVLFMIVWGPWSNLLDLVQNWLSRRHEFEADAFAKSAMGGGAEMMAALKKLSRAHLSHHSPHPAYVAVHYSHPATVERLAALV